MGIQINGQIDDISATDGGLTISDLEINQSGISTFNAGLNIGTGSSIFSPATNILTFGTNSTEKLRIASTGNVSIGTQNVTEGKLQVNGDITAKLQHGSSDMYGMLAGRKFDGTSAMGGYAIRYGDGYETPWIVGYNAGSSYDNQITFGSMTTSDRSLATGVQKRMVIDMASGFVGIGTNNPSYKLHVYDGNARITQPAGTDVTFDINERTTTNPLRLSQTATEARIQNIAAQPFNIRSQAGSGSTSHLAFWTRDDERLRITSDGKVGIGTNNPSQKLEVLGTSNLFGNGGASVQWGDTDYVGHLSFASDGAIIRAASGKALIFHTNHVNERLRIESGGDIKLSNADSIIHTSADTSRLRLFGGSSNSVNNGAALTLHGVNYSGGNYADLASGSGGHIQFRVGTSEKFRITAGGEVLCGLTTTGTDATRNITLHAGTMMRVSNFYMGRVHQSSNNGNAAIVLHKLGQNQGFQMSGSMTFHSYTGSAYLSGCIVCRYNNDDVSRDVSLQKANSGMNLQLVEGTISGVSGTFLAIKKNGGGTGVCYINGFFGGNIEAYGGIREVSNSDWTTTTVHGTGITGSNDSASS